MEIFIVWLALCFVAAVIASNKGRSGFGFFMLALILSPLVGIIGALIASPNQGKVEDKQISTGEHKKCPYCAEIVKIEAVICKHCGKDLESTVSEPAPEPVMDEKPKVYNSATGKME